MIALPDVVEELEEPLDGTNHICKYADDSSLLVPEKCDIDISEELEHVHKWPMKTTQRTF